MSDPILSREEVEALAHRICWNYKHSDDLAMRSYIFGMLTLEQFAAAIEAAVLKKVCGEPAAWAATSEEGTVEALGFNQSRRFDTPLYALTRSKP
ncbi:TPA: hypothetical protein U2T46_000893 [Burkholderia cenocepacia]|nr:hypothetical protein [Burkholderia cenocepacia]